jgi:hypothetical protein
MRGREVPRHEGADLLASIRRQIPTTIARGEPVNAWLAHASPGVASESSPAVLIDA